MSPIHDPRRSVASSLINRLSRGRKLAHVHGLAPQHLTDGRATPWERVDAQWLGPGFIIACRAFPEIHVQTARCPRCRCADNHQQEQGLRWFAALACCIGFAAQHYGT